MAEISARVLTPASFLPPPRSGSAARVVRVYGLGARSADLVARLARGLGAGAEPDGEATAVRATEVQLRPLVDLLIARAPEVGRAIARALEADRVAPPLIAGSHRFDLRARAYVVGILNVTPDSFYDRGRYFGLDRAVAGAETMVEEGADVVEVGGESARPGPPISAEEEMARVLPVLEALAPRVPVPLSVDTYKVDVGRRALDAGAVMINDISGLADVRVAEAARDAGAALVIMHIQGRPKVAQRSPRYGDVVEDVYRFLAERTAQAEASGLPRERILVDPGLSFGKTADHDLEVLRRLGEFRSLGYPIYLATSRKNYLRDVLALPFDELVEGTAAAVAWGVLHGANLVRAHDVRAMVRVCRIVEAIRAMPAPVPAGAGGT